MFLVTPFQDLLQTALDPCKAHKRKHVNDHERVCEISKTQHPDTWKMCYSSLEQCFTHLIVYEKGG